MMKGIDSMSVAQKGQATLVARDKGHLNIKFPTTAMGLQKYAGFVSVPTASGRERTYHFKGEYFVSTPSVTVSPTNMNVLYAGVDNPLSVSITGIPKENLIPSISDGTIRQDPKGNGWFCRVPSGIKEATVTVSAKFEKETKTLGAQAFRVKKLPDPTPTISGRKDGFVSRDNIISAGRIVPLMPVDFDFNYTFQVVSFRLTMDRGFNTYNYDSPSGELTDEMKEQIQRTNRGQVLLFENIVVNGPENEKRILPPFFITIK
jgi:gliding motility-associated protein GldM